MTFTTMGSDFKRVVHLSTGTNDMLHHARVIGRWLNSSLLRNGTLQQTSNIHHPHGTFSNDATYYEDRVGLTKITVCICLFICMSLFKGLLYVD